MAEEFSIEGLLAKLQNDTESKGGSKVKKFFMNTPDNLGATITCLPILTKGEIYVKLDAVREFNTTSKFYKEGEQATWCRLLDRNAYGELTDEENAEWSRTKNLLEELIDKSGDFYTCRFRRYTLVPVHILEFTDPNGVKKADNVGPALLIFPSHSFIHALKTSSDVMSTNMKGNQWMPLIFSTSLKGRKGAITIKFTKSASSKGYDTNLSFAMNSEWATVVDPNKDYASEVTIDPLKDFLAWQAGADKLFNKEVVKELGDSADKELMKYRGAAPTTDSTSTEAPQNEVAPAAPAPEAPATPNAAPTTNQAPF